MMCARSAMYYIYIYCRSGTRSFILSLKRKWFKEKNIIFLKYKMDENITEQQPEFYYYRMNHVVLKEN